MLQPYDVQAGGQRLVDTLLVDRRSLWEGLAEQFALIGADAFEMGKLDRVHDSLLSGSLVRLPLRQQNQQQQNIGHTCCLPNCGQGQAEYTDDQIKHA